MKTDWRDEMWCRHAAFFVETAPFSSGIWLLPDGWRQVIEESLEVIAAIVKADGIGGVTITRLLRLQGVLGLEWSASSLTSEGALRKEVDRVSARAACTCETCGAAGRRYMGLDQATVRCDTHRLRGTTEIIPPWPLIRTERWIEAGVSRILRCEIYDRELDAFVQVRPSELGIAVTP